MTAPVGSIVDMMDDPNMLGPWFSGASWNPWRTVMKAAFALPMTDDERMLFRTLAERDPPQKRVRELYIIVGRRGGKDAIASAIGTHAAAYGDFSACLRPGERALVMCLANDRDQAKIALNYTRSYFERAPLLNAMVTRETNTGLELANGAELAIATNSFRAVRGRAIALCIMDECATWRSEESSAPDIETYRAVLPGLATIPGSMLVAISSPYAQRGLLFDKFKRHFGKDASDVLVIRAPSIVMNPTLDQAMIDRALEEDPEAAAAEWLAEWRRDVSAFVERAVVDAAVVPGRHELEHVTGVTYIAGVDPSGGSSDAMTLSIAHGEKDGRVILDCIRERRPPFSPESVVKEFAETLKSYGVGHVTGDRYAGEWPRERFAEHGIKYIAALKPKTELYRELLPLLNSGKVELLDNSRLVSQLVGLERRTARGGRDSIDHAPNAHDDIANVVAIAVTLAARPPNHGICLAEPVIVRRNDPVSHSDWLAQSGSPFGYPGPFPSGRPW